MEDIFTGLSLVIVLGTAIALVMRLIGQPLIIGHIITGILVGPAVLDLIQAPETFRSFADIGVALLLFIIGLGLNPRVITEVGKVVGIAGLTQIFLITALGWVGGMAVGLDQTDALFFGIALSFSSTIIVLKLLSDKREQLRLYGKIAIGMTLVEDMMATVALLFLTAKGAGSVFSFGAVGLLAFKGLGVGYPLYLLSSYVLPRLQRLIAGSQEFLFLFALSWGFGAAVLFDQIGFSKEVGALFGGVLLSTLPYAQEMATRLRPLRDFFIVLFFINLGADLHLGAVSDLVPLIVIGFVIVVALKPLIGLLTMGLLGYTKRTSFKAAGMLGQVGEFSIIFLALGATQGLVNGSVLSAMTIIVLSSIAASTYLITYIDRLYDAFENRLPFVQSKRSALEHDHRKRYELVLFGFQKGGHEFLKVFRQLKKPYVVIDYDPDMIDVLERQKINFIYGDASNLELLEEAGLHYARLVVSTITDHDTNVSLLSFLAEENPDAVTICMSETPRHAAELYHHGASYVMLPHFIGSEKLSAFVKRVGFKKSEFKKIRDKHLQYLEAELSTIGQQTNEKEQSIGHAILKHLNGA